MLKTYYTFTVVRDPIERVLSAYRDKAFDEFRGGIGIFSLLNLLFKKSVKAVEHTVFLKSEIKQINSSTTMSSPSTDSLLI